MVSTRLAYTESQVRRKVGNRVCTAKAFLVIVGDTAGGDGAAISISPPLVL